ncbi:hypothetical protein F9K50_05235 [bacterium]|nr:MAG: hypothetical protein F9K50_05235 [bacterium]
MKSIALNDVTFHKHHIGFWTNLKKFFQAETVSRNSALQANLQNAPQEEFAFFHHEYELEDYIRSFRE